MVQVMGIQLYKLVSGEEVLVKGGALQILDATRIPEIGMEVELVETVEEGGEATRQPAYAEASASEEPAYGEVLVDDRLVYPGIRGMVCWW